MPALTRVGSMHYGKSSPWDFMHLSFENQAPNLYKLWSGKFKALDTGIEDYEISPKVWETIWQETADAIQHIPADFVRVLGNGPTYFTAESWCFWIVYLAPILLEGRFSNPKYHAHLCQYSDIVKRAIGFEITYDEIDELQENIIDWVKKYEEYYYQYDEERLSACPLTVHVLQHAYLDQLEARFDLEEELATASRKKTMLSRSEQMYADYPHSILRAPYKKANIPDAITRRRIAGYFTAVLGKARKDILPKLPEVMPRWGKVRIVGGDSIRCVCACGDGTHPERNMSYVRYEIQVPHDPEENTWVSEIFYGRIEEILVCNLPKEEFWGSLSDTTRLLAVITPCKTLGKDAAKKITAYKDMTKPIVTDLRTISAVVGRVETRGRWAITDRTGGLVKPMFIADDEGVDEE
ncbi:hypothetical protein FB451DRAFT_1146475 [Mycena latifolia]|nr:hypothetical protein FB451DRAFT_1146475 [Mycena latifolia]